MEEGRLPLPGGILHHGQLWKVGDWIHLQNPNDVTKPIVAQIYRTWQDADGEKWVNACWYYRPEQTVHQHEKHFYPAEVVKTGQYRDHRIDEIVDRCFVMFTTRYSRGRPRGLGPDKEVYVCESRYNEEKHKLNKIKTWASCLPDEVRDKDYEMDLFDGIKKVKKIPSPIVHLLKDDVRDGDELPKPQWGAENAPPIVGAVYKGPREENVSELLGGLGSIMANVMYSNLRRRSQPRRHHRSHHRSQRRLLMMCHATQFISVETVTSMRLSAEIVLSRLSGVLHPRTQMRRKVIQHLHSSNSINILHLPRLFNIPINLPNNLQSIFHKLNMSLPIRPSLITTQRP